MQTGLTIFLVAIGIALVVIKIIQKDSDNGISTITNFNSFQQNAETKKNKALEITGWIAIALFFITCFVLVKFF